MSSCRYLDNARERLEVILKFTRPFVCFCVQTHFKMSLAIIIVVSLIECAWFHPDDTIYKATANLSIRKSDYVWQYHSRSNNSVWEQSDPGNWSISSITWDSRLKLRLTLCVESTRLPGCRPCPSNVDLFTNSVKEVWKAILPFKSCYRADEHVAATYV